MTTLEELRKENQKLRTKMKSLEEMKKIERERNRLAKENKALMIRLKHPGLIKFANKSSKAANSFGKVSSKIGTKIFKGIQSYGNYLNQQDQRRVASVKRRRKRRTTRKRRK